MNGHAHEMSWHTSYWPMTVSVGVLFLVPLAFGGGQPGREIQTPMAIVILCGLTTSTLLNMVVVPTLYLKYGGDPR